MIKQKDNFREYFKEYCENKVQIFPRPSVFEILNGEALIRGIVNKNGKPWPQKNVLEILETHCYTKLTEAQRKLYRETYKSYLEKQPKNKK